MLGSQILAIFLLLGCSTAQQILSPTLSDDERQLFKELLEVRNTSKYVELAEYLKNSTSLEESRCNAFYEHNCASYEKNFPNRHGPLSDIANRNYGLRKKVLISPIEPTDALPLKVVKTLYKQCSDGHKVDDAMKKKIYVQAFAQLKAASGIVFPFFENKTQQAIDSKQFAKFLATLFRHVGSISDYNHPVISSLEPHVDRLRKKEGELFKLLIGNYGFGWLCIKKKLPTYQKEFKTIGHTLSFNATALLKNFESIQAHMKKNLCPASKKRSKYELMNAQQATQRFPLLDFQSFLTAYTANISAELSALVASPNYTFTADVVNLAKIDRYVRTSLLTNFSSQQLANYLYSVAALKIGNTYIGLTDSAAQENEEKQSPIGYAPQMPAAAPDATVPNHLICELMVRRRLRPVWLYLYVAGVGRRQNIEKSRKVVEVIMRYVLHAYRSMVDQVGWLTDATRVHIIKKVNNMKSSLLFPDQIAGKAAIERHHPMLGEQLLNASYTEILFTLHLDAYAQTLQLLTRKEQESSLWDPSVVNAQYRFRENAFTLFLGISQAPLFDPDYPIEWNFGTVGLIIGHELSHGFDNNGINYDYEGRYKPISDPLFVKAFGNMSKCLVDEYSAFCHAHSSGPKHCVNGKQTLGENIADVSGLHASLRAYHHLLDTIAGEAKLPAPFDKLEDSQLFFMGAAQVWCTVKGRAKDAYGFHSPPFYRVYGELRNNPAFGNAFNCYAKNSTYAPSKHCNIWVSHLGATDLKKH